VTVAAVDGYRGTYTFSEVVNRNDQSEVLMIEEQEEGGRLRRLPSADFFSGRAVKAINEIHVTTIEPRRDGGTADSGNETAG